ncbi:MAG: hypothetical protein JOY82_23245 [Streptosporangiaceae bacterium]|nr:hypothetical protein [Streptosporangiaceae bacterium]MBV9857398.1 hypothetical protein [Streptosporangiaceae bacterium]
MAGSVALLAGLALPAGANAGTVAGNHTAPAGGTVARQYHAVAPDHGAAGSTAPGGAVPAGIGVGGTLAPFYFSAQVYQCPKYFRNQGTDYADNDIAANCYLYDYVNKAGLDTDPGSRE